MHKKGFFLIGGLALMLAACAPATDQGHANDPLEPLNRQIFAFNEVVDNLLLEPAARGYRYVTPEVARKGVRNALRNFYEPVTMVNALLQADMDRVLVSGWRFILNTTLGLGGLYDFAGEYGGLPHRQEDFGQTLAVWTGSTDSTYLVLPLLGPSTTRDALGRVVDLFTNPWNYELEIEALIAVDVANGLAQREHLLEPIDEIYKTSFDPYSTFRSMYQQQRRKQIDNRYSDAAVDLY